MQIKYNLQRIIEICAIIFLKLILEYCYAFVIAPIFDYAGLTFDFNAINYAIGWAVYIAGYMFLSSKKALQVFELYLILYFIYVLPIIIFFSLANKQIIELITILLPYFAIVLFTFNFKLSVNFSSGKSKIILIFFSFVLMCVVIAHFYLATGGKIFLSFDNEYAFREKFDNANSAGIFGYLNGWVTNVAAVFLLTWAILNKKIISYIFVSLLILVMFLFSGHKGVIQSVFAVFFVFLIYKRVNPRLFIATSITSFFSVITVITVVTSSLFLGSLLIRRLLFVPAHLHFVYLDFFENNPKVYWSNSILKSFIDYPYDERTVEVVGLYLGFEGLAANVGFVATGYMQAGYFGIFIYTLAVIMLMNIVNYFGKNTGRFFVTALMIIPLSTLFRSTDFFTMILTQGMFLTMLVMMFYSNICVRLKVRNRTLIKL